MAMLWLELAQGLELKARGISFPQHFLVKVNLSEGQVVIDPLTGQSLSREDLSERLEPYRQLTGLEGELEVPLGLYLQAATPREIIARMLHNLKEIHAAQEDWPRLIAVLDRLIVLLPQAWSEYRDRGLAHAEAGHSGHALEDLETYLANTTHDDDNGQHSDRAAIAQRVTELRRATS
jgi:regulator of sirC expression with transglutaminase-like and TPR domain